MLTLRDKLAQLMDSCGLNAREFSPLMSRDEKTVRNYLNGEKIPRSAERWLSRVLSVKCDSKQITVTFRAAGERPGAAFGPKMHGKAKGK